MLQLLLMLLNFFFLDRDAKRCAHYHGDKHLNKMQVEYAQMASTACWLIGKGSAEHMYKATHTHHPMVRWCAQSQAHLAFVIEVGLELAREKVERAVIALRHKKKWKTTHVSTPVLQYIKDHMPPEDAFPLGSMWMDPPACMPEEIRNKGRNIIECYHLYYAHKVDTINLKWEPYVEEPYFINEYRKRLRK